MNAVVKTESEVWVREVEFARVLEHVWRYGSEYDSGDYVRPSLPNGYEYECTTAGQTGSKEPRWPRTVGGTVTDGSAIWTARAFGTNGTDTISSVSVSGSSGITVGAVATDGTKVSYTISGGEDGSRYTISCEVTSSSGENIEHKTKVEIDGD